MKTPGPGNRSDQIKHTGLDPKPRAASMHSESDKQKLATRFTRIAKDKDNATGPGEYWHQTVGSAYLKT